jgi:hypothetical protein
MRKLIRRGLDAYEGRQERRDEEFAELLISGTEALGHRPTLKLFTIISGTLNLIYWICVLLFPRDILDAFETIGGLGDRLVAIVLVFVFGSGLWFAYSLFRFRYPDLEKDPIEEGVLSSFAHQENSYRRFRVWLMCVVFGVLNLLALAIVEGLRL